MSASMDDSPINPGGEWDAWAASEFEGISTLLDRLAEAERASAPCGLGERLLAAVREEVGGVAESERALTALAARERAGAGPTLEDRVFMATRSYLKQRPETAPAQAVRWGAAMRLMRPLAAMAAVIAITGMAWIAVGPGQPTPAPKGSEVARGSDAESVVHLVAFVDQRLDRVLEADWSLPLSDRFEDLSREMESLSQQVRGELFQFGVLADEEAM